MKFVYISAIICAASLNACATDENIAELRESPSFAVGYGDGCVTANEGNKSFSTKQARDDYAFDNDAAYRAGWRQGYLECDARDPGANDGGRVLGERDEF